MKTLLIVSGGDAPGINAALWHYTRIARANNDQMFGVLGGFAGALAEKIVPLSPELLAPFVGQGGTYLPSSREPVLAQPDALPRLKSILYAHGIDNLVLFGGDGTLRHIPPLLRDAGIPCIGLPTTIDNDVPGTERTLGHDSACNYAYPAIEGILATGRALPGRIFIVETLGGNTGFLALAIAHGAGAHAALLPEYPYNDAWLAERLTNAVRDDGYALIVLSEGMPTKSALMNDIPQWTGIRVRDTRLGHAQRGGPPSHIDRALAADMARMAFDALHSGVQTGTIVVRGDRVLLQDGVLTGLPAREPDVVLYQRVNGLLR
jgi:6-phosphofructokinase 1